MFVRRASARPGYASDAALCRKSLWMAAGPDPGSLPPTTLPACPKRQRGVVTAMPVSGRAFALLLCALGAAVLSAAPTFGQLAAEDMGLSENGIEPFCFYNRVAKKVLCRVSGAGRSGQFALGSENGNWAFMMQYGRPKIMKYAKGNVTTEWSSKNAVNLQATPCKSTSFSVIFNITGIVDFRCNGKSYGSLTVYNKRYPKRATIDNNGTVRFIDAKGAVLVTIDPSSGKGPQPPLAFIIRGPAALANTTPRKATTMKKLPTTVKRVYTTPRSIGTLVFPKANPRNILLQSDCKYVPVPYFSSYDPKKTFNIELIGCGTDSVVDGLFVKAAMTWCVP